MPKKKVKGFTLIELLIVIAILVILAVIVVLAINPLEMLRKSRDSQRFSDLTTLRTAINLWSADQERSNSDYGTAGTVYASNDAGSTQAVDGSGWIPINFTNMSAGQGAPVSALPRDPSNPTMAYRYGTDGSGNWELDCPVESTANTSRASNDGGNNTDRYEVGTDLTILD
jgi:prepilin-type N-terminal cleavage/methylation domain-containing protein